MKKTRDGRRQFSREFKVAALRRGTEGEKLGAVARDLNIGFELLSRWQKRVSERGEAHLYGIGERSPGGRKVTHESSQLRRIAELERLVGQQQLEAKSVV